MKALHLLVSSKLLLTGILLVMSLVNGHNSYVSKYPRKFMADNIVSGMAGGLVGAFLSFSRGRPDLWMEHAFVGTIFFFFFNVCREFSGFYAFSGDQTQLEAEETEAIRIPFIIGSVCMLLIFVYMALSVRDQPNFSRGFLSNVPYPFIVEMISTVAIFSLGEMVASNNHGESMSVAIPVMLAISHILLQYGGFYRDLYIS
jgi:hypothetical protein